MRILFSTQPLHGHVNTVLPQALAARDAGHEVLISTGASMAEVVGSFGLELAAVGPESAPRGPGTDFMAFFVASAHERVEPMVELIRSWQPDLVVHEETELSAAVAGSLTSTRFVVHGLGLLPSLQIWEMWSSTVVGIAQERGADLEVADLRDHTTYLQVCPDGLIASGERFWRVVRPLRHTPGSARPGEELPKRINRMPFDRLVHLTLGTVFNEQADVLRTALAGLRDLPVNIVVTTGPDTDPASLGPQPDNVLVAPYVSHALLLPRCDLVVSHGGSGAMFGTLANALPQLVLPQGVDQDWNAVALVESGAGLAIERDAVTIGAVRDAAAQLLAEPRFGQRATDISREMAAMPDPATVVAQRHRMREISLREATKAWFVISLQTFGGPAGQIAVMQRTLVDEKRWLGQRRFLHALNFCMLLPGPEAQQLAIYTGWLLNGMRGGIIAGTLFVLPGMIALLALSALYVGYGETDFLTGLFVGLSSAVIAIVVQAVVRLSGRALTHPSLVVLAVAAFVALAFFAVPFPLVILAAGGLGWLVARRWPGLAEPPPTRADDGPPPLISDDHLHAERPSHGRSLVILLVGLVIWFTPLVAFALTFGRDSVFVEQGLFFSWTAVITFGGAYAVLTYVAQQAVNVYGWLSPGEMVNGLALAETTPGPLIMVVQFVAFVGAYRDPGTLDPWVAAVLASLLTTWVTFVPCFLFVLLGAPYIERLRHNRGLAAALTGITAAVVGVIASLAAYFALHTLFDETESIDNGPFQFEVPVAGSIDLGALAITVIAAFLILRLRWGVLRTLGICAVLGLLVQYA